MAASRRRPAPQSVEVDPAADDAVSDALAALAAGQPGALDALVPLLYDELRRLARQRLRHERDSHTLDTTALVHEAYLRLVGQRQLRPADRGAFFAAAANTMRRVLVDYARARRRQKRGSGEAPLPLEEVAPFLSDRAAEETLALDDALAHLAAAAPRAAKVFSLRLFAGLGVEDIAATLGVSAKTVQRDWEAARSWLRKEVGGELGDGPGGSR